MRCYHREQLRLATIGAQVNSNIVGLTKDPVSGDGSDSNRTSTNGSAGSSDEKQPESAPKSFKGRNAK